MINALCHLCCSDGNTAVSGLSWLWCDGKTWTSCWAVKSDHLVAHDVGPFAIAVFSPTCSFPQSSGSFDFPPLTLQLSLSSSRPVEGSCGRWRASCGHAGLMTPPCDRFFVCDVLFRVRVSTATEPFVIKLIYLPSKVYYFKRIASELILCKFVQKHCFHPSLWSKHNIQFLQWFIKPCLKPKPKLCSGAL